MPQPAVEETPGPLRKARATVAAMAESLGLEAKRKPAMPLEPAHHGHLELGTRVILSLRAWVGITVMVVTTTGSALAIYYAMDRRVGVIESWVLSHEREVALKWDAVLKRWDEDKLEQRELRAELRDLIREIKRQ